jgi:hypothetical protein
MRNLPSLVAVVAAALAAGACGSDVADRSPDSPPTAAPLARDRARAAKEAAAEEPGENRTQSRVLAYVDGEVVTYRDVTLRIGPVLAMLESDEERDRKEQEELLAVLEDRILYGAAQAAGVGAARDEIEESRAEFVAKLAKSGGTLEAYLTERGMTRRELDEMLRRQIVMRKYLYAAIGLGGDPNVRVRAVTDTYVSPSDVRKYYDRHPERFRDPAGARYRIMTFTPDLSDPDPKKANAAARARADAALARLRGGEDWVPLYREIHAGAEAPDPMDGLVDVRRGDKPDWIEDVAFGKPKGTLDLVTKGRTCYILRAEGARDERVVPFEERQSEIRKYLIDLRRTMAGYEVELSLLDEASIRPEPLKARLRDSLRKTRLKMMSEAGL